LIQKLKPGEDLIQKSISKTLWFYNKIKKPNLTGQTKTIADQVAYVCN